MLKKRFPKDRVRRVVIRFCSLGQKKKNKNVSGNMPEKKWVDRLGFFFFFFFREALSCKVPEHRYTV